MSMKEDLTGEPIHLVEDDTPDAIPEDMSRKGLMNRGFGPKHPGPHFPTSRDWNMPTIKCGRKDCAANYSGKCTMPSLVEIGPKGCKGYHKRRSGKKK